MVGGEIYILDKAFNPLGILDSYESLIWDEKYYELSEFEIYTAVSANALSLLAIDHLVYIKNSDRIGVIEDIIISNSNGQMMLTARGNMAEGLLNRRVFDHLYTYEGTLSEVVNSIIENHITAPTDNTRAFYAISKSIHVEGNSVTIPADSNYYIEKLYGNSKVNSNTISSIGESSINVKNGFNIEMHTTSASQSLQIKDIVLRRLNDSIYDELVINHKKKTAQIIRRVGAARVGNDTALIMDRYNSVNWWNVLGFIGNVEVTPGLYHVNVPNAIAGSAVKCAYFGDGNSSWNSSATKDWCSTVTADKRINFTVSSSDGASAGIVDIGSTSYDSWAHKGIGKVELLYQLEKESVETVSYFDYNKKFESYSITSNGISAYQEGSYLIGTTLEEQEASNPFEVGYTGDTTEVSVQGCGENIGDYLIELLKSYNMGFRARFNGTDKIILEVYKGTDRSFNSKETNQYIFFSRGNDNLESSTYARLGSGVKNFVYVGGEGEGAARVFQTAGDANGWDRREVFVDASDTSSKLENDVTLTPDQYKKVLKARAQSSLFVDTDSLEGSIAMTEMYIYNKDFFLGDIVTIQDDELDVYTNKRIVGVCQVWDANGYTLDPTFESSDSKME